MPATQLRFCCALLFPLAAAATASAAQPDQLNTASIERFLSQHCAECHGADEPEGGLDLSSLSTDLSDTAEFSRWVLVHDRVTAGEMPPEAALDRIERDRFTQHLFQSLADADRARIESSGRAIWRRMNRFEYENTLRDLLSAPWLQVKQILPEDGELHRFNKVGEALDTSHVQVARYLQAADYALRQVIAPHREPPDSAPRRYYARDQPALTRRLRYNVFNRSPERAVFPLLGHEADLEVLDDETAPATLADADPARRELEAFGVVASSYEPLELRFDSFTAPIPGHYKLRFSTYTFWAGPGEGERWWRPDRHTTSRGRRSEPVSVYSQAPPRLLRHLGGFDAYPEPAVQELDVWLLAGETIRPDASRLFRSRPPAWHNPLAELDGMPGVAFRWLEVEGPLYDSWPPAGHRLLFDDLAIEDREDGQGINVLTSKPRRDAARLMRRFLERATRRPVDPHDLARFTALTEQAMATGSSFMEAMLAGYSAVLCSPNFVCLQEQPGALSGDEIAARLSYFLWNSEPDELLRNYARGGQLSDPAVLARETERLLDDPKSRRFVDAFLDYWLDLRKATDTSPSETMYPDYYLDDLLVESAVEETRLYFSELIDQNLSVRNLIGSDFTFLNEPLANHYQVPGVEGITLRRVSLPDDSPRGGLLTQASLLKVTANGTTTSPVSRGAWVVERILGQKPPPPPPSVPAIEPDTRGAKTIREQLARHRQLESCNQCHAKIDPAGFALESFDVLGGWRDNYRAISDDQEAAVGFGKNGQPFTFHFAQKVDSSGQLPDGRRFEDIHEFKRLLLEDPRQIARNLVRQLLIYGTAAPIRFADRTDIERILDRARADDYGVRSIIHAVVASELFGSK